MDVSSEGTTTACAERLEPADDVSGPPSLWRSVVHAFRHAQLQRLEARVNRLRQRTHVAPPVHEQRMLLVAAESPQHADARWPSVPTTQPRRSWPFTAVACLLTLIGITGSALLLQSRADVVTPLLSPGSASHVTTVSQETTELRTLLTSLDDRLTMLHRQVLQQGDQLTNQAATVLGVTQHNDTQQTQVAALADALTVLTSQVAHIEQHMAAHATRLAAQEQQRVSHTTQGDAVQPPTRNVGRVAPVAPGRTRRPPPPMLEVFAPPASPTTSPVPHMPPSPAAVGTPPSRRAITLPAALGVEGYRAATGTPERTQP